MTGIVLAGALGLGIPLGMFLLFRWLDAKFLGRLGL
jgi:hypothetical protein